MFAYGAYKELFMSEEKSYSGTKMRIEIAFILTHLLKFLKVAINIFNINHFVKLSEMMKEILNLWTLIWMTQPIIIDQKANIGY